MRMHTSRITDLLVNLNSKNGAHGSSTRARFCSLMGIDGQNLDLAIETFQNRGNLNTRADTRISSSLRYLQDNGIKLSLGKSICNPEVEPFIENLEKEMTQDSSSRFFVYTDGSTDPKNPSGNSGCSAVISNAEHKIIWSGGMVVRGMVVRADGNNFISD